MRGKKPNFSTDSEKAFNKFQHPFMQPHGTQPTWLLYPRDSPGRNAGVGCHALLQRIFPDPGIKPVSLTSPALAGEFFTTSPIWVPQEL